MDMIYVLQVPVSKSYTQVDMMREVPGDLELGVMHTCKWEESLSSDYILQTPFPGHYYFLSQTA
jgi:hypothetical protein